MTGTDLELRTSSSPARTRGYRRGMLARGLVLRALRRVRGGQLELREGRRRIVLGHPDDKSPLRAVIEVRSPLFYRQLLRGSVGLCESYLDGQWECSDLVAMTRIAARNVARARPPAAHRRADPSPGAALRPPAAPQHPAPLAAADRSPLRPRQRAVRAVPRRDDDVLVRVFETPRQPLHEASMREARAICATACELGPGDHVLEIGTGWGGFAVHAAGALRLPRDDDDDLARTVRATRAPRVADGGLERPRDGARTGLPRPARAATTSSSRSR